MFLLLTKNSGILVGQIESFVLSVDVGTGHETERLLRSPVQTVQAVLDVLRSTGRCHNSMHYQISTEQDEG